MSVCNKNKLRILWRINGYIQGMRVWYEEYLVLIQATAHAVPCVE